MSYDGVANSELPDLGSKALGVPKGREARYVSGVARSSDSVSRMRVYECSVRIGPTDANLFVSLANSTTCCKRHTSVRRLLVISADIASIFVPMLLRFGGGAPY